MKISLTAVAATLLLASQAAVAAPCDDNFSVSGNFLSGKVFSSWAILAGVKPDSAFKNLTAFTLAHGFKIVASDKERGTISAVQAASMASGKKIPLEISLVTSADGLKLSLSYATPGAAMSPEEAVKAHFCKTIAAAGNPIDDAIAPTAKSSAAGAKPDAGAAAPVEPSASASSEFVKNGMPCLGGVCIGDEVGTLGKIKLDVIPAKNLHAQEGYVKMWAPKLATGATPIEALREASPYMALGQFDNGGIAKLARLKGFCDRVSNVYATYKSESGFVTTIGVAAMPAVAPAVATLRVVSIQRKYPDAYTKAQFMELNEQFKQRYASIPGTSNKTPGMVRWEMGSGFLTLTGADIVMFNQDQFKQHPGCLQQLKID